MRRVPADQLQRDTRPSVDGATRARVVEIIQDVRRRGRQAALEHRTRLDGLDEGQPLVLERDDLGSALEACEHRALLERVAARIRSFASAQRESIRPLDVEVPGGRAGHTIEPVRAAGCYAPGGRHPLPSSVLMTAVTAREAGCERVVVATPSDDPIMLASAAIAGADQVLRLGGAQAVAALAYGFDGFAPVDVIAGPGNRWVTAAKAEVSRDVGIDMLAGPSELLVIADAGADPAVVASDLLAQAEHDTDALPMLVTTDDALADAVDREIDAQLAELPTADVASVAIRQGFTCVVSSIDEAVALANHLAPEHLEIITREARSVAARIVNAGGIFIGSDAAEVIGDYGAGPNHTLPTGGSARHQAGLSVSHFLRLRTWIEIDDRAGASDLYDDARALAALEGLPAHAAAASRRI